MGQKIPVKWNNGMWSVASLHWPWWQECGCFPGVLLHPILADIITMHTTVSQGKSEAWTLRPQHSFKGIDLWPQPFFKYILVTFINTHQALKTSAHIIWSNSANHGKEWPNSSWQLGEPFAHEHLLSTPFGQGLKPAAMLHIPAQTHSAPWLIGSGCIFALKWRPGWQVHPTVDQS
jgi:hypothetical protein